MTFNSGEHGLSFGAAAEHYDRIRPTYPAEAVQWCVGAAVSGPTARARIVDLGAGTGLLTRVLIAAFDAEVIPVEPDPLMRAQLSESTTGVTPLAGSAETIPLGDGSVDAVLVGQAYHWFDRPKAHAEIGRVVRPGGVFAPIWNIRDESVPWVADYTRVIEDDRAGRHDGHLDEADFGDAFGPVEAAVFRHSVPMTADGLVALLGSRSYYLTATPARQAELNAKVRALADALPPTFELPYETYCYRAERR
ncbi:MAG TPA: class I SAM-dependent methyltransferase [Micromonosporaceae bacterium]|jgi:SAM-dependent methyltransferase